VRSFSRCFTLVLLSAALVAPALTGCAVHARVYDSYHQDYHEWPAEQSYYVQWETETHRSHEDFKKRNSDEQKEYWDWRHSHDHDQNHP
jgi:hypothetical protein